MGVHLDPKIHNDSRGRLTVVEFADLPWEPKRAYFLSHSNIAEVRGAHAHKELSQYFFALSGTWNFRFFDGKTWTNKELVDGNHGILISPGLWREISTDDPHGVLAVFASQPYLESDYIHNLNEYIEWKK